MGGPIDKLSQMVISRSESAYKYFLATQCRLVSVVRTFLVSARPGLSCCHEAKRQKEPID